MAGTPKRRSTDPIPGTKGPQRGDNDAFKLRAPKTEPKTGAPFEGTLGKRRRGTIDSIVDSASKGEKPKPFKSGGMVRGMGKSRKGC